MSVVTPVYNGERYLRECIDSVLGQTYENWDYTIVNNCSSDATFEIAREYANRDSRIRVTTNESFVRVIQNHNIAFRSISPGSKYCKVVAADDWIYPECLEKMVKVAEEHPSVAIVGAYGYGFKGTNVVWDGLPYPSTVVPGPALCRRTLLGGPYVFGAPTSVLYRSDIVRSRAAFYNESNFHADTEVCFEFLERHDFGFVHQVLTFSRVREESLSSYSARLNTYLAENLYLLCQYGSKYLCEHELRRLLRWRLRDYYRYLGRQVFERRGTEFWRYHRGKLAAQGYPLSIAFLAAAAAYCVLDVLLNPMRTAEDVAHRIQRALERSRVRDEVVASVRSLPDKQAGL